MRFVPVAADAPAAEAVRVDFVDNVAGPVRIAEARRVDGAALVQRAGQRRVRGGVGAHHGGGGCGADAVFGCVAIRDGGEVHHEGAVVELGDVWCPGGAGAPCGQRGERVGARDGPGGEVGGGGHGDVETAGGGGEGVVGAGDLEESWVGEVGGDDGAGGEGALLDGELEGGDCCCEEQGDCPEEHAGILTDGLFLRR